MSGNFAPPRRPLNGAKTHPLSQHALAELKELRQAPVPCCGVNPGVKNRLLREGGLVEVVDLPSPFPTHKGEEHPAPPYHGGGEGGGFL